MSLVKGAMLLLLLAVIGINAAPGPEDCDGLNKTLSAQDLHKIQGGWLLVWAVAEPFCPMIGNLSSQHIQISVLPGNKTVQLRERNVVNYGTMSCVKYSLNMSTPADPDQHLLQVDQATEEKNGVVGPYNHEGKVDFFESCSDCLVMDYKITLGRYLYIYRRIGSPMDPELLKASHSDYEKLAKCLGFPHDKPFIYHGAADYCLTGEILHYGDDAFLS